MSGHLNTPLQMEFTVRRMPAKQRGLKVYGRVFIIFIHPASGMVYEAQKTMALLEFLKKENIHLEVCPTSNIQTNVYDTIHDHSADKIYNSGVSMSISTDCRTISDTTLTNEYGIMEKIFKWKKEHFLKCNLEAIEHCFTTKEKKEILKEKLMAGFK